MAEDKTKASVLDSAVMTADGLTFKGVIMNPVVENCMGCDRIALFQEVSYCSTYAQPATKWTSGTCNFSTHIKAAVGSKAKVNPLKASKRAAKGR